MDRFEVIIYWSDEDSAFVAEVPELPGCMAHGATHAAALKNAKAAMRLWIKTAQEFGDHGDGGSAWRAHPRKEKAASGVQRFDAGGRRCSGSWIAAVTEAKTGANKAVGKGRKKGPPDKK
jgi:predicted RNase H-like HicB family nuclease